MAAEILNFPRRRDPPLPRSSTPRRFDVDQCQARRILRKAFLKVALERELLYALRRLL
jgi:hypothetical protein